MTTSKLTLEAVQLSTFLSTIIPIIEARALTTTSDATWTTIWMEWNNKEISSCKTVRALSQVLQDGKYTRQTTFKSLITIMRERIPILDEEFIFEVDDDYGDYIMYRKDDNISESITSEPWTPVIKGKHSTPASHYESPDQNTLTPQSYQNLKTNEKVSTPSDISSSKSIQTTKSTSEKTENTKQNKNKNNPTKPDVTFITFEKYIEIENKLKSQDHKDIDLFELEAYISQSMYNADIKFQSELNEYTTNTTKKISAHKNTLKSELSDHVQRIKSDMTRIEKDVIKMKKSLHNEEIMHIDHISTSANNVMTKLTDKYESAKQLCTQMNDLEKEVLSTMHQLKVHKNELNKISLDSIANLINDSHHLIQDCKSDFNEWLQRRIDKNNIDDPSATHNIVIQQQNTIKTLHERIVTLESMRTNNDINERFQQLQHQIDHLKPPTPGELFKRNYKGNINTLPTNNTPHIPKAKFKYGNNIIYKQDKTNHMLKGTIIESKYNDKESMWTYTIVLDPVEPAEINGTIISNCYEFQLQHRNSQPSPTKSNYSSHDYDRDDDSERDFNGTNDNQFWNNNEILADNEYKYPKGSKAKRIMIPQMLKHSKEWNIIVNTSYDLRKMYHRLRNYMSRYNILLIPYDDITRTGTLLEINEENCTNYESASKTMSIGIFDYFDEHKDNLFKDYVPPKYALKAFEHSNDGVGFLRHIMKGQHPKLRDITDYDRMDKPQFLKHVDIHSFLSKYLDWLQEENMMNGRKYTDKENMDYILEQLDDRFDTARVKIETRMNELFSDPNNPQPFPPHLQTNPSLSINIMNLIPQKEQKNTDFTNSTNATINRMITRSRAKEQNPYQKKSFEPPKWKNLKDFHSSNDIQKKNYQDKQVNNPKVTVPSSVTKANNKWASALQWKYLPGQTCTACGQNNHEIYETGCPAMSIFCNCKEFFDKHTEEELEPVLKQFALFKSGQMKQQKKKRNEYRKQIRKLSAVGDTPQIKKIFLDSYIEEFPEEEYIEENPFDTLELEPENEDDNSEE
jgi:hypothetical protein